MDNENNNVAVTKALDPWIALAARGPAVAFVDHAAAAAEVMVSRGATAKFNDLDLSYGFEREAGAAPNRVDPWRVRITVEKDRDGLLGNRTDRVVTLHPQLGGDLALAYADEQGQTHRLAADPIDVLVSKIADLNPPARSANDAYKRVGGTRQHVLKAYRWWSGS